MGNGYNDQQNLHRSTFLPMLCSRPSIKDVHLPKWEDRWTSFSDDPSSPRVSCIGQVKRHNKVTGYPTTSLRFTTPTTTTPTPTNFKYSKLKKLFSSKNLIAAAATTVTSSSSSCRREMIIMDSARSGPKFNDQHHHYVPMNMDPPLPVIKRPVQQQQPTDEVNLWKRRSGGVLLKTLQIQQIHIPNNHLLQPTTV